MLPLLLNANHLQCEPLGLPLKLKIIGTILEIVAELCQLVASHPHGRPALKTFPEIVGLLWLTQAILMGGGPVNNP